MSKTDSNTSSTPHTLHMSPIHAAATPLLALLLIIAAASTTLFTTPKRNTNALPFTQVNHLIDINSADAQTLHLLPNVGPILAQRIIIARPFTSTTDLQRRVSGIGPITAADIAPYIEFGD